MNKSNRAEFGPQLRHCRLMARMTQEDLALEVGLDGGSSISHYERNENKPSQERLDDIIRCLRKHGATDDCLKTLKIYSGYEHTTEISELASRLDKLIAQQEKFIFDPTLIERILDELLSDLERMKNAYIDLRRGQYWEATGAYTVIVTTTEEDYRHRLRIHIQALRGLAESLRLDGQLDEARSYLTDAIHKGETLGREENVTLAGLYLMRGNINRRKSDWERVKNDYRKSYDILKMIELATGVRRDRETAIIERKIAGTHLFMGQPHKALEHCNRSIDSFEGISDIDEVLKTHQHKAWAFAMLGKWDDALVIHKSIVQQLQRRGAPPIRLAKSMRYLADTYRMCGILPKAINVYDDALEKLEDFYSGSAEGDNLVYGMILLGKGSAYRAYPKFAKEAGKLLDKSVEIHKKIGAKLHEALSRVELGKLYDQLNKSPLARAEYRKSEKLFDDLQNDYYRVAQIINWGNSFYITKNYRESRARALEAISQARELGYPVHLVRAKVQLAEINLMDPDEDNPLRLFHDALHIASSLNPYLVHEVFSHIAGEQHMLTSENVQPRTLELCKKAISSWQSPPETAIIQDESLSDWLNELSEMKNNLVSESTFNNGHALIVGIRNYTNLPVLGKTTTDANDFNDLLLESGYQANNITTLTDDKATKIAMSEALDKLAIITEPDDTVIFFFSGHGARSVGGFHKGEYLCPVKANGDLRSTGISNEELTSAIEAIPARHVVVFLDACHSGGVGEPKGNSSIKSGLTETTYNQIAASRGRVVIASCEPDEVSWELPGMRNGLFTHFLLEGLKSGAKNEDGGVYILELFRYISENVQKRKRTQHPLLQAKMNIDFPVLPIS